MEMFQLNKSPDSTYKNAHCSASNKHQINNQINCLYNIQIAFSYIRFHYVKSSTSIIDTSHLSATIKFNISMLKLHITLIKTM